MQEFQNRSSKIKPNNPKIEPNQSKPFRTLDLAVEFYGMIQGLKITEHLKDQLIRAASSISLNLAEGNAKGTVNEKRHFFQTAYASLQECKTVFKLLKITSGDCFDKADHLGGSIYKLVNSNIKAFADRKSDSQV